MSDNRPAEAAGGSEPTLLDHVTAGRPLPPDFAPEVVAGLTKQLMRAAEQQRRVMAGVDLAALTKPSLVERFMKQIDVSQLARGGISPSIKAALEAQQRAADTNRTALARAAVEFERQQQRAYVRPVIDVVAEQHRNTMSAATQTNELLSDLVAAVTRLADATADASERARRSNRVTIVMATGGVLATLVVATAAQLSWWETALLALGVLALVPISWTPWRRVYARVRWRTEPSAE